MDPLSVTAAIVGILCAAAKVAPVLSSFVRNTRGASKLAQAVLDEVNGLSVVLSQLQTYLLGTASSSRSRASLILVEQVLVTLAECVATFSELEDVLEIARIETDLKIIDRVKWAMKESIVSDIQSLSPTFLSAIVRSISALSSQVDVFSKSMEEAESAMIRLCNLVEQVLAKNEEMSLRLRNIDDAIAKQCQSTMPKDDDDASISSNRTVLLPLNAAINVSPTVQQTEFSFTFEQDLLATRVYRKPLVSRSGASFKTSTARTTAASALSALSLTDISNISVLGIPIYAHEISNSNHYTFGREDSRPSPLTGGSEQAPIIPTGWHRRLMNAVKPDAPQKGMKPDSSLKTDYSYQPIMGVPLRLSISRAQSAIAYTSINGEELFYEHGPVLVAKAGAFLKKRALTVENIFATAGSPDRLQRLETIFNEHPQYGKGIKWTRYSVHDAANILLKFLLQLPEPIIPINQYGTFRLLWKTMRDEPGLAIRECQQLCSELPDLSRDLLVYLSNILALTAQKSDINKMTIRRLAVIFQPAILSPVPPYMFPHMFDADFIEEPFSLQQSQDIVAFLIENEHQINYTYVQISNIFFKVDNYYCALQKDWREFSN